jgi:hypothetical protein
VVGVCPCEVGGGSFGGVTLGFSDESVNQEKNDQGSALAGTAVSTANNITEASATHDRPQRIPTPRFDPQRINRKKLSHLGRVWYLKVFIGVAETKHAVVKVGQARQYRPSWCGEQDHAGNVTQ